jgi:hypothetical protein
MTICKNRSCKKFFGQQPTPRFYNDLRRVFRLKSRPQRAPDRLALNCAANFKLDGSLKDPAKPFTVKTRRRLGAR